MLVLRLPNANFFEFPLPLTPMQCLHHSDCTCRQPKHFQIQQCYLLVAFLLSTSSNFMGLKVLQRLCSSSGNLIFFALLHNSILSTFSSREFKIYFHNYLIAASCDKGIRIYFWGHVLTSSWVPFRLLTADLRIL